MAAWESGQPWEPSGCRLGAAGREPLPGPLSLGWGWLFQGLAQPVERLAAVAWHVCPCLPALAAAHHSHTGGAAPRDLGKGSSEWPRGRDGSGRGCVPRSSPLTIRAGLGPVRGLGSRKPGAGGLGGEGPHSALALEVLLVLWMGGPKGSLELQPGISSAGCQGQASRAPPPAWPDLPSLGENCPLSLEAGGGAVRAFCCPGRGGVTSWVWGYVALPQSPQKPPSP